MFFEAVDTADKRRLSGAGWATDDNSLTGVNIQVDAFQSLKITKVLVYIPERYDDFGRYCRGNLPFLFIFFRLTLHDLPLVPFWSKLFLLATQFAL